MKRSPFDAIIDDFEAAFAALAATAWTDAAELARDRLVDKFQSAKYAQAEARRTGDPVVESVYRAEVRSLGAMARRVVKKFGKHG